MKKLKKYLSNIKKSKFWENKYFPYVMIFVFAVLLLLPSINGKFHLGDDSLFHMANIKVSADNLPFSVFSKILPDLANNFGFGVGIFYPPLPHIVGAFIYKIINVFGMGVVTTETILHFLIFFTSGITMYWLGKVVFKDDKKGLFAALFYITYNYFFVDVIVRDALNESFMFVFMPLVFLGLYYLFNNHDVKRFYLFFVIGYIGLMYSHLVMSVWFTIFLLLFLLFYVKEIFKKKNFWHLCLAALMILIFTSTFTVPMMEHKLSGVDYVSFIERKWTYDSVWTMPWHGFFLNYSYATGSGVDAGVIYSNLNFIVIIFFALALIRILQKKTDKTLCRFLLAVASFGIFGIILNTFKSFWLYVPSLLLSIQFPWRLSQFVGFGFALVAAEGLTTYLNLFKAKFINVALIILLAFLGAFVVINNNKTTFSKDFDLSDLLTYGSTREHFPAKIYENIDDFWNKKYKITILDGDANVNILADDTPYMKFEVKNIDDTVKLELPRVYYLGYEITDEDGNVMDYECNDPGYVSVNIDKEGIYEVSYTGTTAYKIAFVIKIVMLFAIVCYLIYYRTTKLRD